MPDYEVVFARSARKELESLDRTLAIRILSRIEKLVVNPRPAGAHKLRGSRTLWRLRIGDYRVVYAVHDDHRLVDIVAIRHRREAYG